MTPAGTRDTVPGMERRGRLRRISAALAVPVVVLAVLLVARRRRPDEGQPLFPCDPPSQETIMNRRIVLAELERLVARVEGGEHQGVAFAFIAKMQALELYWQTGRDDAARARRAEKLDLCLRMLAALDARIDPAWTPPDDLLWQMPSPFSDDPAVVARREQIRATLDDPRNEVQRNLRAGAKDIETSLSIMIENEYGPFPADQRQLTERITARIQRPELRDRLLARIRR
jgi:hypothetical protein